MAKRRISQKTISEIGITRINRLLDLSVEAVRQGRNDRARRYVGLARRIGMKTRTTMPKDRKYCKECLCVFNLCYDLGVSCTVFYCEAILLNLINRFFIFIYNF